MEIRSEPMEHERHAVILLHGLFATTRSMRKAASQAQASGYHVVNWGYPTFWRSIDAHSKALVPVLESLEQNQNILSINFLTHSLGGILARCAIEMGDFRKVHRMVMLAPPNSGSHLTRLPLGPFARFLPAIAELSECSTSLPNRLRQPKGVEVGIIAASADFIVRVANTTLPYQRDHCIVEASHFELPNLDNVLSMAIRFLSSGSFREAIPSTVRQAA